ncbi:MAG: nuclear transport factor 2 family protein [Nitrososphaerales archaeon]
MTDSQDQKRKVFELLRSIETGDHAPIAYIDPGRYVQHNLGVADGLQGFAELMKQLPPGSARARPVRVFQDGDMVFAHTEYDFFGPKIGFDVFRFQDGRIVEHWDNLQETAKTPNPSGHTMVDGPTEARDPGRTEDNRALVRSFVEEIFISGRMEKLAGYFDGDRYAQHNPHVADGLSGLGKAMEAWSRQGVVLKYDRIHRVLAEGNFVLTVGEGSLSGTHSAFYDLFRVEDGKVSEHWDVVEAIPPLDQRKNGNGKF